MGNGLCVGSMNFRERILITEFCAKNLIRCSHVYMKTYWYMEL